MNWMLTCREATEYVSRALDERLSLGDRVALRMHLIICPSCLRFERQMRSLNHCLNTLQHAERFVYLPDAVRERIKHQLHELANQGEQS
jgi:predicted anti-sigma-YlaC factor YlaD